MSAVFVVVKLPDCIVARSIFSLVLGRQTYWSGGGERKWAYICMARLEKKGASIGVKGGTKGEKAKFIGGNLGEPNYSVI